MESAGRVAIVTGSAQGIGEGIARRLAAEGYAVAVTDRRESVRAVADEIGGRAFVGDVADADHVRAAVDAVHGTFGRIDVLVNNAGEVRATGPLDPWARAVADYDALMASNVRGAFLFGRAVAPIMVESGGGDIVNVSTDHVKPAPEHHRHHGHGYMDLYNASKWALNGLTFDWARALRPHGIRVNNLCMGATDTAMLRGWLDGEPDPDVVATWMTPAQIAQVVVDLIAEGPDGRTADNIGLYAGHPCELPPPA